MANNEQKQKTFKYGDREYSIDDLLQLHAQLENNYYNFARDRGRYDDTALAGLREAITNRINAIKNGESFLGDGVLSTDSPDNIEILTNKRVLKRKNEYTKQDNTEWAKYYVNKLVELLLKNPSSNKGSWDKTKHGLEAYLNGMGLNAQQIFENYDLPTSEDPEEVRSHNDRRELLKKQLTNYKNWLESKGFDFTKNDNEWDDNTLTDLNTLLADFDNQDINTISNYLRKLGAGNDYTTAFTSNKWDLSKSNADIAADKQKHQAEKDAKQKKVYLDEFEDVAYNARRESNPLYYKPIDYSTHDFNGKEANLINWYADLNPSQQSQYGTYLGRDNQKWTNAWNIYTQALRNGTSYNDKNLGILLQGTFANLPNGFIDLGDGTYLIKDSVNDLGQGTVYDPNSGYTNTVFLGDLANSNESIKNIYQQLAYKYINNKYGTKYEDRPDVFKEGGNLIQKYQHGGSSVIFNWENPHEAITPKAEANGVSVKTQEARDQYIDEDNKSVDNPNAGLTAALLARLGYAALDLTSAIAAFVPGYGTAISAGTGVTSTLGNFWSDLTDDAVTTGQAWKNFGLNLGMDALGLIPGGGAAAKMGKIVKTLKTIVPYVVALPGVASMLANSPEIAASWKKAFDGDPDDGGSKMDYQDYMNILQVINVATGVTTIGRNAYKSAKKSTKQTDKLAVDVNDSEGKRRALVLEGDDITKFKEANAKGEALKFVDELEGPGKYTINEITKANRGKFWGKDQNGKFKLFNQNPLGQSNTGKAHTLELKWDNKKGLMYAETGKWDADLGYNPSKSDEIIRSSENAWKRTTLTEVDAPFAEWRLKATTYKANTDKLSKIRDNVNARIKAQNKSITDTQAAIESKQRVIDDSTTKASEIQEWLNAGGVTASKKSIRNARAKIKRLEKSKVGKSVNEQRLIDDKIAQLEADIAMTKATMDANTPEAVLSAQEAATGATAEKSTLQVELGKLQTMLDKLTGTKTKLDIRIGTHSKAYNLIRDFQPIKKKFGAVEYTFDASPELRNLDGLYKYGGSINRNKINKFLNYAKG